ncbi:MAG: gliding motility-associated C-terminal domain-containing protein [Runella sp.]
MKKNLHFKLLLMLLLPLGSWASHIVGGEIEFYPTNRAANRFYIGLNLYFDQTNGRAGAETPTVKLYFFRKSDNQSMGMIELPQTLRKLISYTNPTCNETLTDLRTLLMRYSGEIIINTANFDDPRGYYVVWERCCRNQIINNIVNPSNTGATFYTEFPPLVTTTGQPIINSSPQFGELKGDYICLNRPFSFDFSGRDADGDSLVYSLVRPWAGFSSPNAAEPVARGSSAYPEVTWVAGISDANMIPGPRPLSINRRTGVLSVTSDRAGLYVFAVMVEEFRRGVRIGAVKREFQLKVVDCPRNFAPEALYREPGKATFYRQGETLTIRRNQTKCLEVLITDRDPNQRLTIKTIGLNFDDKGVSANPATFVTRSSTDTLRTQICFDKCIESRNNQPVIVEVIVSDDGCPQPQSDTLRLRVMIEESINNKPSVTTDLSNNRASIVQGTPLTFRVTANDRDNDDLILEARGRGFQLAQVGMTFNNATGKGSITQPFTWNPPCTALDREYVVDFIVTDINCNRQIKDTVTVRLQATPKPNNKPRVTTSLGNTTTVTVPQPSADEGGILRFEVYADDADRSDVLRLFAVSRGFTLAQYRMKFDDKVGPPRLTSVFEWKPNCTEYAQLAGKDLVVNFVAEDNSCGPIKTDTLAVRLKFDKLAVVETLEENIPNIITPNNDGKNDCFFVEGIVSTSCGPQFDKIQIFNRWGKLVYQSSDPLFKWCGEGVTAGTYFYALIFSNRTVKGTLTVVK